MNDPMRLALIGIDHPHAAGYRETVQQMPEVEIVGIYDPDPAAAASQLAEPLWRLPLYSDLEELLRKERPEAALIALPNDATPAAIIACAQAGVHVYAEKPCARTAAEFLPAAEALERAGVQFCTGYARRIMPIGQMIKRVVDEGLLGRLTSIEARWITTSVQARNPQHFLFCHARSGGGMLHWLGSHWLDLMRWCTGSEVAEVMAVLSTLSEAGIDVEDTAGLALRYDNGMVGSLHCAYVTDQSSDQLYFGLRGSQGWLHWERSGPELVVHSAIRPGARPPPARCASKRMSRPATWAPAAPTCSAASLPPFARGRRPSSGRRMPCACWRRWMPPMNRRAAAAA